MTRGRVKETKSLTLTGNLFLKYEYDVSSEFVPGDILFVLNNDSTSPIKGGYFTTGHAGYFKLYVYDGFSWCHLIDNEFFDNKENHFSKKEIPIDNFNFIKDFVAKYEGAKVYRSYRDHYTQYLHQMNTFKGKKGHYNEKKLNKKR